MATNQASFTLTKQERRQLERLAKTAGLSFSNYVRQCCGLEPLQHGGKRKRKAKEDRAILTNKPGGDKRSNQ